MAKAKRVNRGRYIVRVTVATCEPISKKNARNFVQGALELNLDLYGKKLGVIKARATTVDVQ